ncbi:DUF1292 domain-containing protein [Anaerococcus sp. Marseille-P3625]|uniref:DUF1292 domain-containing protein n=1 Tax=Anaerococcus sp. Marseille-P3625 TaxID=1977277 RepID=UPI000C06B03A|nr:DUF1292 domain-containing protein [Anaerococcus sp. Marseille-P3625]
MSEKLQIHGHELEFLKNEGKAVIQLDFGEDSEECYLIDIFSVDDVDYVALISSMSNEIYLFYYEDSFDNDENEIDLKTIEDDDEIEEVFHLFSHYWNDDAIDQLVEDYNTDLEIRENTEDVIIDEEIIYEKEDIDLEDKDE